MAYTKELKHACEYSKFCEKQAVVGVYTWRNELRGDYCRAHSERVLTAQNQIEARLDQERERHGLP